MRLLLVHHQRPHFEVVLALLANLGPRYDIRVWSNALHFFERRALLSQLGAGLFDPALEYDALVIVSGEQTPSDVDAGPVLAKLLRTRPVLRIMHRAAAEESPGELRFFPKSRLPFVPVVTGLPGRTEGVLADASRSLLIQGNVENRRNYALLPQLISKFPGLAFNVVGLKVTTELPAAPNLSIYLNQPEREFHSICAASTFILPLIDPVSYRGYFTDRFTSSIHIGFAYALPFIAHRALFDLYPIAGLAYSTDAEFHECLERAERMSAEAVTSLRAEMEQARERQEQLNLARFATHLSEAMRAWEPDSLDANA
jgi:hypothetical protein